MTKRKSLRKIIGIGLIIWGLSYYIPGLVVKSYEGILKTRLNIMSRYN